MFLNIFLGELIGTFLMILLGNGVVANVLLSRSKGKDAGWIVIAFGWGLAVAVAVYLSGWSSGAHLNPVVTFSFAISKAVPWSVVPVYWLGQMFGAMIGSFFVWLTYYAHFKATEDLQLRLLCFSTAPAIRSPIWNFVTETIATMALMLGIFGILSSNNQLASGLGPYLVGILVVGIGLSLGGPTGYAINPARDIGPRLTYSFLYGFKTADWKYAWIPGLAPFIGAILGVCVYKAL